MSGLQRSVEAFKAAGEPTRLRLLALLSAGELTVKDLTDILGQSQPRISRHLKLLADAGLVGLPNAGKSTFLAAVTAAKPKIADYPFTTLHPNLAVARIDAREFVIADIPGLIEGAHGGVGIGDRFLGHVERTRVLLHLVSAREDDPSKAYKTVRGELVAYGHGLADKPEIVALSQADLLDEGERKKKLAKLKKACGHDVHVISSATGENMDAVQRALMEIIATARADDTPQEADDRWQKL